MSELPLEPLELSAGMGSFGCGVAPASRSNILAQDDKKMIKLKHDQGFLRVLCD